MVGPALGAFSNGASSSWMDLLLARAAAGDGEIIWTKQSESSSDGISTTGVRGELMMAMSSPLMGRTNVKQSRLSNEEGGNWSEIHCSVDDGDDVPSSASCRAMSTPQEGDQEGSKG